MELTLRKYKEYEKSLQEVLESLAEVQELQKQAAEQGDLSENEEYSTARAEAERLTGERLRLENILAEAEIVPEDHSPRITLGSTIEFYKVDANGNPISEVRRLLLESSGDSITQGILGVNSSLGKAILNGTDGIYSVHENGGTRYHVKKVPNA